MMPSVARSPDRRWTLALLVGLVAAAVLVVHALSYLPLVYDDAYISLRYAKRLLEGHGLSWTDGEAVEGYSNLLWVLACAGLGWLGMDLVDAARALGLAGGIAAVSAFVVAYRPRSLSGSLPALAGGLFIALAGPIAIWCVAGLEGALVAGLLAWAIVLLRPLLDEETADWKDAMRPGLPLALLCLTRVDGPLFTMAACAFLLAHGRLAPRGLLLALRVGAVPGLATLGQIVFRLFYYGDWVPNTARAKVAFTGARLDYGIQCMSQAALSSFALWIPAALALVVAWRDSRRRPVMLLTSSLFLVWTSYATAVTTHPFGYRMLIPCYVLLAFLVSEGLDWALTRGRTLTIAAWLATVVLLAVFGWSQQQDRNIAMARGRLPTVSWKGSVIGKLLRRAFLARDPLVAVDAAGSIPYHSGLRSLDMLGLSDAYLTHHRPADFGHGWQGHELGSGDYVLDRKPDLIVTGILGSDKLSYRGGRDLMADPRFYQQYRVVRMWGDDPTPLDFFVWCRLEGRVGVRQDGSGITIPGFLFAGEPGAEARFNAAGDFGTEFTSSQPVRLVGVELPEGRWRLWAHGTGDFDLTVRRDADADPFSVGRQSIEFRLNAPGTLELSVSVSQSQNAFLTSVVARRVPD